MSPWVENYISILSFITKVGAFNGFLLTIIFATYRKGNIRANRFFALILAVLTLRLIELSFHISGTIWKVPFLAGSTPPLLFLIGPAFWLYTKRLWNGDFKLKFVHLTLLLPFVWSFWRSSNWIFYDTTQKTALLKHTEPWSQNEISTLQFINFGILILHTAIYLALVVRDLRRYKNAIEDKSSNNIDINKFRWLKRLTTGLFLYVIGFFITMVLLATTDSYDILIDRGWIVILTFFVHSVGFLAIQQPQFLGLEEEKQSVIPPPEKYVSSPLEGTKAEELFQELNTLMKQNKLFRNPGLKASEIAEQLNIPMYQLSHLLSLKSEFNFFEFVNNYRVEEAKELLLNSDNKHLTILAIGMEAGFNSKSSFNRAFKKNTGKTPSDFKRLHA